MPADLFDPASRPSPAGSSRRLTVTTSIALHVAAVVLLVILPLVSGVTLPASMDGISNYVLAETLPTPPMPQPPPPPAPATAPVPNPDAAPIDAPRSIEPEVDRLPEGVTAVPGGVPVPGSTGVPGGLIQQESVTLAPPPPARGPLPVGGNISPPRRTTYVPPLYPPIAQSARVEGTVILEAIISERGEVTAVKVLRSVPLLDDAARAAVAKWRYSPTTLNGVNVAVIMTVTVTFSLK